MKIFLSTDGKTQDNEKLELLAKRRIQSVRSRYNSDFIRNQLTRGLMGNSVQSVQRFQRVVSPSEKLCNETAQCPETVNNLLITNKSFGGEVKTNLQTIKRYHGRFGMNHVHVVKLQIVADTTLMKRIRQLTHPNLLEFFYLTENCSQT